MNCIKLGKLMLEVDIKHFQVKALADINGLQTRNLHHCQVFQPKQPENLKTIYDKRQRILTNSLPFCYVKNIIPKNEYFYFRIFIDPTL